MAKFIELVGPQGLVVGCEPLPFAYQGLTEKFRTPNVRLLNVALADKAGEQEFVFNTSYPEESGLKERIYNRDSTGGLQRFTCRVETVDSIMQGLPRLPLM